MTIQPIAPKNVRYIKLGEGGCWESDCIRNGTIRLGYASNQHKECIAKEWDKIKDFWLSQRKGNQGAATRDANQIRDFYELAESDLWITIRQRKLYWCHAAKEVVELTDKTRIRHVIGQWHSTDINNQALWIENLDGRVTQVTGFRGTICDVTQKDYLVCKINGQKNTTVLQAEESLALLNQHIKELIKGLWWHDFELLIELIFSKFGWQRFSVMGKREKDIDLDLRLAANEKGAVVQIKSHTTRQEAQNCIRTLQGYEKRDEIYFVYHTSNESLSDLGDKQKVHVWGPRIIAQHVVNTGLAQWLIHRRS